MIVQNDKPSIIINHNRNVNKNDIKPLLYGIEEEGIPYELKESDSDDILSLSYNACISSKLGVGLGISSSEAALHFDKLEESSPLFRIKLNSKNKRFLGVNAARLVKKMPFKNLD